MAGGGKEKPPFLAFAVDAKDIETLKAFATSQGWDESSILQGDIRTATEHLKKHPAPSLLLVELPSAKEAPTLLDDLANVCDPETKVITIGDINEYSFYCWLTEIGIFSYLLKPLTDQMLESTHQKASRPAGAATGKAPAKVIAVTGTRGGVGASTVALNLAGIIADLSKKQVTLADLDPQEGSISLMLDIEPSRGLRDALEKPDRIDSLFIERVMTKPLKNLSVLSAEESLQERITIHDSAADILLRELREKCDILILDVPRHMTGFARAGLKQAEHVVMVTDLTLLSLRDALRQVDLMRDTLKIKLPPMVVASRVGLAAKQEMQPADFEKGVNAKIVQKIPFAPDVFMQISNDIPALKQKAHAAMKPLYALAEQLVPQAKLKTVAKEKAGFTLFKKKEA